MNRSKSNIYLKQTPVKFRTVNKLRNNSLSQNHIDIDRASFSLPPCTPRQSIEALTPRLQQTTRLNNLDQQQQTQKDLSQTLKEANFKHHAEDSCMCGECTCGRHLCKFNIIRPQLNNKSSYHHEFPAKQTFKNLILVAKESPAVKSDSLVKNSFYGKEFMGRGGSKSQLLKTNDQLTHLSTGPIQSITSYSNHFYHRPGVNQYIKPTDSFSIGHTPFSGRTTYAKQFNGKGTIRRSKSLKVTDSLKTGAVWLGKSAYNMKFQNPNPEDYQKPNLKMSRSEKILQSPQFVSRFKTIYKQDFPEKLSTLCPMKKQLNSGSKFSHLRKMLNEQGDFRGLNPQFKAIATSKHFYV